MVAKMVNMFKLIGVCFKAQLWTIDPWSSLLWFFVMAAIQSDYQNDIWEKMTINSLLHPNKIFEFSGCLVQMKFALMHPAGTSVISS